MKRGLVLLALVALVIGMASCCRICRPAKAVEVKGVKWGLIELRDKVIEQTDDGGQGSFFLILGEDGRITGRGDCNAFFAAYTLAGNRIMISTVASTRMLCPARELENSYFQTLESADRASIDGDFLILQDKGGKIIASFKKIERE